MNTVEYLIKKLKELGIDNFFGLPGDYNLGIVSEIENNPEVSWIGCTNELNAGYAADGYARQKGYGALVTTYGVGELSAMNAVAGSYAENVPVVHIVGVPSAESFGSEKIIHHSFLGAAPETFMESQKNIVGAYTFLKKDGAKLEIDRVLKILVKEKKPVYIAIPEDVALVNVAERKIDYEWVSDSDNLEKVIKRICEKINHSEKPLILADTLIRRFGANQEFSDFAEKSGIPVTNLLMGAGIYGSGNKNYIGTFLSKYGNEEANKLIIETDCLISVGVINGDLNTYYAKFPYKINSHIAIYGTYTYVEGTIYENVKMADVLKGITNSVRHRDYEQNTENFVPEKISPSKENLSLEYIYQRLQEFIKKDDIIIVENGLIPHGFFKMNFPENTEIHSQLLWCSIGWATAGALGVCIAKPDSRVILVTGDGAHQVSAMEIGTMCRYGVKPVVIVINNQGYSVERVLSGQPDSKFNDIMQMDYSKFVRSFAGDIWSTKVGTEDDFDKALRVTQIMDKLCHVTAMTDKNDIPANLPFGAETVLNKEHKKQKREKTITNSNDKFIYETSVHASIKEYME